MTQTSHPFAPVIEFWFEQLEPAMWWQKSAALDQEITTRFGALHRAVAAGECDQWRRTACGALAEVLVLDQFSRNIFRNQAQAFAYDGMALVLAQSAIALGFDQELTPVQRSFIYLPYMHSESPHIHARAMVLYDQPGLENNLEFERQHKAIIDRFGRYPHRNAALSRTSTAAEIEFLADHSGF